MANFPMMPSSLEPRFRLSPYAEQALAGDEKGPSWLAQLLSKPGLSNALMTVGAGMMAQSDQPGSTVLGNLGRALPAGMGAMQQGAQAQQYQQMLQGIENPQMRQAMGLLSPAEGAKLRLQQLSPPAPERWKAVGSNMFDMLNERFLTPPSDTPQSEEDIKLIDQARRAIGWELHGFDSDPSSWDWDEINNVYQQWRNREAASGVAPGIQSLYKGYEGRVDEALSNADQSFGAMQRFGQMRNMIQSGDMESGGFQEATLGIRQLFYDMFNVADQGLGMQEAFQGITNQTALFLKPEAMTGQMSDNDLKFLERAAPRLANTPEGNLILIDFYEAVARNQIQFASDLEEWLRQNPTGLGMMGFKQRWVEEHPMFTTPDMTEADIDAAVERLGGGGGNPLARRREGI